MRGDTSMSPQRARGFLAESRFIHLANKPPERHARKPRGYVRVRQAPPIMDVRGIDGFVEHYRGSYAGITRLIPIQFKTGPDARSSYFTTHCGLQIPIIGTHVQIEQHQVFERLRLLLDSHDRIPREYDAKKLHDLEYNRPTTGELQVVELIEQSRKAFEYTSLSEAYTQIAGVTL